MPVSTAANWPSPRHAWYAVAIVSLANTVSFADRQVFALLLQPIKADLALSDTRLSLLQGLGFVALYATVSLPAARCADLWDRTRVIVAAVMVLSCMTALCATARNFFSLFAARLGVGAAEGALNPAAQSLLSDYLPPQRLPVALSFHATGVYVGGGFALLLGGWLYSVAGTLHSVSIPLVGLQQGWRLVLLCLCLPGLLFGLLCATIREPARQHIAAPQSGCDVSLNALWQQLLRQRKVYIGVTVGFCLMIVVGAGTSAWIPTFFVRCHHWTLQQVGLRYGTTVLVAGTAGVLCGGYLAATLRRRGFLAANLSIGLTGFLALIPFAIAYPLVSDPWTALGLVAGYNFFAGFPFGGGYAALLEITPNRMRAQVVALFALFANVVGQGGGPTLVAVLTDYLFRDDGALSKSLALLALVASPLAAAFLWYGRRHYRAAQLTALSSTI